MKKTVISEIKTIKKMMGLLIENEGKSHYDCLYDMISNFYFVKSEVSRTGEFGDGGALYMWNKNEIPEMNDMKAWTRFLDLVKEDYEDGIVWNEQCGEQPTWEEALPTIKLLYFEILRRQSNPKTKVYSEIDIPELIDMYSEEMDIESFSDEFEWADNIISAIVDKLIEGMNIDPSREDDVYDTLYDKIKDEYGEQLTGFSNPFI